MKKWRKYILCILIVTICGSILSFIRKESVLVCDIYVMMGILIFEKMDDVAAGIAKSKEEKDNVEKGFN